MRDGSIEFEPFAERHVAAASEIAAARTADLRGRVPTVPERWATPTPWSGVLSSIAVRGVGRAAIRDDRVVGVLAGWPVRAGQPRVFCPEGAAGVAPDLGPRDARHIVEGLVEAVERDWVRDGVRTHFVSVMAGDGVLQEALAWLGFGIAVVDALAETDALAGADASGAAVGAPGLTVRQAGLGDLDDVLRLEAGLRDHLVDSPTYLVIGHPIERAEWSASLADEASATFFAMDTSGAAIAFLRVGPTADDVAQVVRDPGTVSISRAFTTPDRRGTGIATELLAVAAAWARERGAVRVGVDFESANVLARRFWSAHFAPVVLTHCRQLHPLAGTAEAAR